VPTQRSRTVNSVRIERSMNPQTGELSATFDLAVVEFTYEVTTDDGEKLTRDTHLAIPLTADEQTRVGNLFAALKARLR